VFLGGAVAAVAGALLMVVTSFAGLPAKIAAPVSRSVS
jgi:hypothetical protein